MQLYRGDSVPTNLNGASVRGRSFAEYFLSNGLMAKFSDGGSSSLVQGKDLIDLVLSHVGYEYGLPEQALAYHSPMLSFSESEQTALNFITTRSKRNLTLKECTPEKASHFVWKLSPILPQQSEIGVYDLRFKASSKNCKAIAEDQLSRACKEQATSDDITGLPDAIINLFSALRADIDDILHQARLINVVEFIGGQNLNGRNLRLVELALKRSLRDKEWLLYPCDPMPDGFGISGRFPMNEWLTYHKYFQVEHQNV